MLFSVLVVVGSALLFLLQMAPADSPVVSAASDPPAMVHFSLVDQNGNQVTERDYTGRNLLVFFGFTNCPKICPTTLASLGSAVAMATETDTRTDQFQILFVSVDPQRDTPQVMQQYVAHFQGNVTGLTGSREQITAITKDFRVHFSTEKNNADGEYSVFHSDLVYLVSETGRYLTHIKVNMDVVQLSARIQQEFRVPAGVSEAG
jgi:protein SCO1/2